MSVIEYMREEGYTAIIFSIIAAVTSIALHIFYMFLIADSDNKDDDPSMEVKIPPYVGWAVLCHNVLNMHYITALGIKFGSGTLPFPYMCLSISNVIAAGSSNFYTLLFMANQDKNVIPGLWLFPHLVFVLVSSYVIVHYQRISYLYHIYGILASLSGILMYATPLPLVIKGHKLKSVQYNPLWLSISYFINGFALVIVALHSSYFDPYLFIPHVVGTMFGLLSIQVILSSTWCPDIPPLWKGWKIVRRDGGA